MSPKYAGFEVELLEEKEIKKDYWYAISLFCNDGSIILSMQGSPQGSTLILCSLDSGNTWIEKGKFREVKYMDEKGMRVFELELIKSRLPIIGHLKQLSDGSIISISYNIANSLIRLEQEYKPYVAVVRRAKTPGDLLEGNYIDDFVKIGIPNLAACCGDSPGYHTGSIYKIMELDNGDLLVPMMGRFKGDNVRVPYHSFEAYQFRNWVCISRDRGYTWNYLSTIASPLEHKLPALSEGYHETDIVKIDNQKILAVMRTGGNPTPEGTTERYTDLVSSISRDGGSSWGAPKTVYKYGVFPRLIKMTNGIIVCSSGRPGVFLLFSADDGETWSPPHIVTDYHAKWRECSSGYTSIGEIEPGVLCIFYDDVYNDESGRIHNIVKTRKYKVICCEKKLCDELAERREDIGGDRNEARKTT